MQSEPSAHLFLSKDVSLCCIRTAPTIEDVPVPLDQADQDKVIQWFRSKLPNLHCAACGTAEWSLGETVSFPLSQRNDIVIAGPHVPAILLVCNNCQNLMFFSLVGMGIVPGVAP